MTEERIEEAEIVEEVLEEGEEIAEETEIDEAADEEMIDFAEGAYPSDLENKNKKMRNKAPAFIFDYWKTNRESERENMRRQEEEGTADKPWSRTEKIYLAIIIVCVVLLGIKYGPAIMDKLNF